MSINLHPAYEARLCARFSTSAAAISKDWQAAELLHAPDMALPYTKLEASIEAPEVTPTALYVNGFTEGIVTKLPFGAALAQEGIPTVLPNQLRTMPRFRIGDRWSTAAEEQAAGMLSVICRERLRGNDLAIVGHSYGGLVVSAMAKVARYFELDCLEGSRVVMLAPAGMNGGETWCNLAWRTQRSVRAERKSAKAFSDQEGVMFQASRRHITQRPLRTYREIRDIRKREVDYKAIFAAGVISMDVVDYARDDLMPAHLKHAYMERAIEEGVRWMTAYAPKRNDGLPDGIESATHNDEQFNPHRVAPLVAQLLRQQPARLLAQLAK